MQKGSEKAKTNEGDESAGWKADGGVMNGVRELYVMYADGPLRPGSHSVATLVQALRWPVEAHTKTVVHRAKVSRCSPPISAGQSHPCPVVVGVEVAVIGSSRPPARTKSGVRAMGMTSACGRGQGVSEATAGGHFAGESHLEPNSAWVVPEEGSTSVG